MTRFVRNGDPAVSENGPLMLTITGKYGAYQGTYSNNLVLIGHGKTTIEIQLLNETDDASATIADYSSTGVTAKQSPIKRFAPSPDRQSAIMTISLHPHQLIDFGVFVEVSDGRHPTTILFCDPQASNDPIKNT